MPLDHKLVEKLNLCNDRTDELLKIMNQRINLLDDMRLSNKFKSLDLKVKNSFLANEEPNSNQSKKKLNDYSQIPTCLNDFYSKLDSIRPREMCEINSKLDNTLNQNQDSNLSNIPLTRTEILRYYNSKLTDFEKKEVQKYFKFWFIGSEAEKIKASKNSILNYGFDDEHGSYIKVLHDHIAYRYEILKLIGKGSYGQVLRVFDHKTKQIVALKILKNKIPFHVQGRTEIKILSQIRRKDLDDKYNVVHMYDNFYFRDHLCITFELLSMNINQLIKKNNYQGLNIRLIQKFAISILTCLKFLYQERIIHCDLKPENILLKNEKTNTLKVVDFGSSCYTDDKPNSYVQSRFYRAPEVILGNYYSTAIDMWSFACVLFELYTGEPLFPGQNETDQLQYIMEVINLPPKDLIQNATRRSYHFDHFGNPLCLKNKFNSNKNRRKLGTRDLRLEMKCTDNFFIDFLYKCLTWKQEDRMTPSQAFEHPWIKSFYYQQNNSNTISFNNNNCSNQSQKVQHFTVRELIIDELLNKTRLKH